MAKYGAINAQIVFLDELVRELSISAEFALCGLTEGVDYFPPGRFGSGRCSTWVHLDAAIQIASKNGNLIAARQLGAARNSNPGATKLPLPIVPAPIAPFPKGTWQPQTAAEIAEQFAFSKFM